MKKILLAEDDSDFAIILKQYLELHNFSVCWAKNGEEALQLFKNNAFDICIFDVMMPIIDGFSLAEKINTINLDIPFLFLTARNRNEDKIKGLKLGADDYIFKPFEADELVLRIINILKRSDTGIVNTNVSRQLVMGNCSFDINRLELKTKNRTQQLTEKESALLVFLYNHKNQLLKREQILQAVWGNNDFFSGRSMDVYISKLRKYFAEEAAISIESIRNIGLEFKVKQKNADL